MYCFLAKEFVLVFKGESPIPLLGAIVTGKEKNKSKQYVSKAYLTDGSTFCIIRKTNALTFHFPLVSLRT